MEENYGQKIYEMLLVLAKGKVLTHSQVVAETERIAGVMFSITDQLLIDEVVSRFEENNAVKAFDPDVLTDGSYDSNSWVFAQHKDRPEYFTRYRLYLRNEEFEESVIDKIQQNSERVLSLCADPATSVTAPLSDRHKKGLVVGDVQSGKTANYLGLMNVACDYGYKIIVLLAGGTNSLRTQTQKRVDSGLIGAKSDTSNSENMIYIGVGEGPKRRFAIPLTNTVKDFVKSTKLSNNARPEDYNKPIVFVVKKNASVLRALHGWLQPGCNDIQANSILIIDDEADYASVNTNKEDRDPTKINGLIRDIFNNFPIASYVGYTATPFANVFIDPYDDNAYQDLFPSNFIIQLNSPTNYFGYEKVFPEGERKHLVLITEGEADLLPASTDGDAIIEAILDKGDNLTEYQKREYLKTILDQMRSQCLRYELPQSLKDAVLNFLIGNVIRTQRGQPTKHRSMMINVSWLNDVQSNIRDAVADYVEYLKQVIAQDATKSTELFVRNKDMARLFEIYNEDDFYAEIRKKFSFEVIKAGIYDEIKQFQIAVINSRYKGDERFDYEKHEERGARAILIGGFVLSRGLTLEGLMTSYYSRSASAYDTLLQMCRWFGYRPKYEDLCRIFIIESAVHEFEEVIDAVENLKLQFRRMSAARKTPSEFGLMIKQAPDTLGTKALLPSARNKLRKSVVVERRLDFGGVYTDTSKLYKDPKVNLKNRDAVSKFFKTLEKEGLFVGKIGSKSTISKVKGHFVAGLLKEIVVPYENTKFSGESVADYILRDAPDDEWDVLIATGTSARLFNGEKAPVRSFEAKTYESFIRVAGGNNRLSEPSMFATGMNGDEITKARQHAALRCATKNPPPKSNDPVAIDYLSVRKNPLLIILPLVLKTTTKLRKADGTIDEVSDSSKEALVAEFGDEFVWGFGIGFPAKETGVPIVYRINYIKRDEQLADLIEDNEEEEDD